MTMEPFNRLLLMGEIDMTTLDSKMIKVNETVFSFANLKDNPSKYLAILNTIFRASTMTQKSTESYNEYLKRLFRLAYYNRHLAVESTESVVESVDSQDEDSDIQNVNSNSSLSIRNAILSTLGINIISASKTNSKIIFKNSGNDYKISNENLNKLITTITNKSSYEHSNIDVKFGVELEFIGLADSNARSDFKQAMNKLVGADKFDARYCYHHNDGTKWDLGTDGSLRTNQRGFCGYELTTPILSLDNADDLETLKRVIELVYIHFQAYTNKTCGTHIHMSFNVPKVTNALIKQFACAYKNSEDSLYDKIVRKDRVNNHYCRSVNPDYTSNRFCKLNFENAKMGTDNFHLEFRQLQGMLDYNKIIAWTKLQKLFIEFTMSSIKDDSTEFESLELEKAICDESFNITDVESFLVMSKMAV